MLEEAGAQPPEFFAAEILTQLPRYGLSLDAPEVTSLARYLAEQGKPFEPFTDFHALSDALA